ncbi:MAG: hypothetical protein ACTHJ6_04175 [Oryzihumus sp.]
MTSTAPRPGRSVATDEVLALLMHEVQQARQAWADERCEARHGGAPIESPARVRLLAALEAYAAALESRHLPLPPSIRDELRLRRGVRGDQPYRAP